MRLVCVYGVDEENREDRKIGRIGTNGIDGIDGINGINGKFPSSEAPLFILLKGAERVLKCTKGY